MSKRKRCSSHCPCRGPKVHWSEREPGYFQREELPAELRKWGREWWPDASDTARSFSSAALIRALKACVGAYERPVRSVKAELQFQSKRLSGVVQDT